MCNSAGDAKNNLNDYQGALYDIDKIIEFNPNNDEYYYFRGYTKYILEDYYGALDDFNKAIELNPDNNIYKEGRKSANCKIINLERQ